MEKVIGYVSLKVADVDNMIDYYTNIIGLELQSKNDGEAWLGVKSDRLIHLVEVKNYRYSNSITGLYHTAFLVPSRRDLGEFLASVIEHPSFVGASDHGYSEALYLNDPEGNGIEVYCDKNVTDWDIRDSGEIVGITERLDYPGVLGEVVSSFEKMPSGTFIGHVHLTVSDLDKTEDFYNDLLALDLKLDYGGMAKFFSYDNYHHHIGTNVWRGTDIEPYNDNNLGLDHFTINLVDSRYELVYEKLKASNLIIEELYNGVIVKDPNGIKIKLIKVS